MAATKTAKTPATMTAAPDIGDLYVQFRRLEREHATISALDASRGDLGLRGELTKRRDAALAAVRAAADAVLDQE